LCIFVNKRQEQKKKEKGKGFSDKRPVGTPD